MALRKVHLFDLLPKELQKFGIDAVINNAAVPGYDTGLELLLLMKLKGLGCPDLVLMVCTGTDRENGSPSRSHAVYSD
jgi:hypothetical protein